MLPASFSFLFLSLSPRQLLFLEGQGQLCLETQTYHTWAHKHLNRWAKHPSPLARTTQGLMQFLCPLKEGEGKPQTMTLNSEIEFAIHVHKPIILPITLQVSRTISTSLHFTCTIPMRTRESQQRKTQKICFYRRLSSRRDFLISLITNSCQCIMDPVALIQFIFLNLISYI